MPTSKARCDETVMAVIYTGLQEGCFASASDAEALAREIGHLETSIWNYCGERYLGIFPMVEKVAPQFAQLTEFHIAADTCHMVRDFLEPLINNGTTHVLIVGTAAALVAIEAKKHMLYTCVFLPATRGLHSLEELNAAGVVITETASALNVFLDAALDRRAGVYPHRPKCICDLTVKGESLSPAWCAYKSNNFLWKTIMRLRRAVTAVTTAGFDGVWPPYKEKDPARKYRGRWLCSETEKEELHAAIDQASVAGIHVDGAVYIYSYIP